MSFQIEYTGSLVDNRDLPQISASSSLVRSTFTRYTPSSWVANTGAYGSLPVLYGLFQPVSGNPNSIYTSAGSGITVTDLGSILRLDSSSEQFTNTIFRCVVPSDGGVFNYRFRTNTVTGTWNWAANLVNSNGSVNNVYNSSQTLSSNTTYAYSGSTTTGSYLDIIFQPNGGSLVDLEYVEVYRGGTSSVSITPTTLTNGVQKTGGTAIVPTITTVQDGAPSVTGPANKFGLVAIDGSPIASAQYYPPATDSEDSYASVTDTKTITASTNNISVEATGLDGEEKIERGSSVLVEDVTHLEENP